MDPYQVLGVDEDASDDELRAAYRRLIRIHHPDRHARASPTEQALHERRMAEVTGAWRLVNDAAAMARHRARNPRPSAASDERPTGFDYRDAAASEFTVPDQGRWGRTPNATRGSTAASTPPKPSRADSAASPRSPWRRLVGWVFWVLVGTVFLGGAWVAFTAEGQDFFDELLGNDPTAPADVGPTTAGSPGAPGTEEFAPDTSGVPRLVTGDCFDLDVERDDGAPVEGPGRVVDLRVVACGDPHTHEVVASVRLPGEPNAPWPGRTTLLAQLDPVCDDGFRVVLGSVPTSADPWQGGTLTPAESSWEAGDRQGVCHVTRANGAAVQGSLVAGSLAP